MSRHIHRRHAGPSHASISLADLNIDDLAARLGGEVDRRRGQINCPGPGHSPVDRSLGVLLDWQAPEGFVIFSRCDDDIGECRDHVKRLAGLGDGHRAVRRDEMPRRSPTPVDDKRTSTAGRIWREAVSAKGTIAEAYLNSRALLLPAGSDLLRFHPSHPWLENGELIFVPAMIALLRDPVTNEPCGIHRTRLSPEGQKLGRKMLGTAGAIKLDDDTEVLEGLHIGEGIETCLAARQMGFCPVWALGSAGSISAFPVLAGIEALTILGETDEASRRAIAECSARWLAAELECLVVGAIAGGDVLDAMGRVSQ